MISRRTLLLQSIAAGVGVALNPGAAGIASAMSAAGAGRAGAGPKKRLVCIFMRGGVDGLNVVVPHGDDEYYAVRKEIAVPPPGKGTGSALRLDARFGLNPGLSGLLSLYQNGQLACVHAAGSPSLTRSHFEAQDNMESGTPLDSGTRDGWLNRHMQATSVGEVSLLRAVSLGQTLPRALYGSAPAIAIDSVENFGLRAPERFRERLQSGFRKMYESGKDEAGMAGLSALDTVELVRQKTSGRYVPENGAEYPRSGRALMSVARLLKADLGVEFAWVDVGGWDTHANQGAGEGQLANRLKDLGDSLAAFHRDMGSRMKDTVVVTMSEFGRTVRQNGTGGTDHGHGGVMLLMGGGVRGGRVHGKWPGLNEADLHEGRDLAVTTDFRDVLGQVLNRHLKAPSLAAVFPNPNFSPTPGLRLFA